MGKKAVKEMAEEKTIVAYKGFDAEMKCRGLQFEVGKTYEHKGPIKLCASGFHACEAPLNVFEYYSPVTGKYATVELGGVSNETESDSKRVGKSLTIKASLSIAGLVSAHIKWVQSNLTAGPPATNTGYQSAATNTGNYSAATNTGDRSAAINTGDRSAATNTGYRSAATNTGYQSAATNTGYQSAATNTGYQSAATNTGNYSAAEASGKNSVAIATGEEGRCKAGEGGAIVLVNRASDGSIRHIKCAKVGEGIKADTWYTLSDSGIFMEILEGDSK